MKKLISALWLISTLATGAAWAQPYAPNDAGVTNGHWHLNSRDVAARGADERDRGMPTGPSRFEIIA